MAENTTQIEGVKISGLLEKTTLTGAEMFVMADSGSNKKVATSTLKAYIGIKQEETARQQADTRLSNLIQGVDEERKAVELVLLTASGDSDITVFDAGDHDLQQQLDGYDWDTIPHFLSGLSAEDMIDSGTIPLLIARDENDNITECAIFKLPVEATTTTALHNLANYAPLSLASLYDMMQRKLTNSADVTIGGERNNTLTLTDRARHAVFDDLWLQAVRAAGSIDYTDAAAPYVCNGIHHTYKEAKYLYDQGHPRHGCLANFYKSCPIKTNLPPHLSAIDGGTHMFSGCSSLTKVNMSLLLPLLATFANCTSLKYIECYSPVAQTGNIDSVYLNCSALQTIEVRTVFPRDFDVADSPLLDLTTFQGFVSKYDGSKAITIYVHPDVYAKLTDPDHIVNAQWYAAMTQAVNKKIAFATKE